MKATGIIRRIDELGRVVIPKEIRRTMRLREGEELEIFTSNEELILKKYSEIKMITDFIKDYVEAIADTLESSIIATDTDRVIALAGTKLREYKDKLLSTNFDKVIAERKNIILLGEDVVPIVEGDNFEWASQAIAPIIVAGDMYGALILLSEKSINDFELKFISAASVFIGKQIER